MDHTFAACAILIHSEELGVLRSGRPRTVDVSLFFDKSGSKVTSLDAPLLEGPAARRRVLIQILTAVPRREYEGISLQAGAILVSACPCCRRITILRLTASLPSTTSHC